MYLAADLQSQSEKVWMDDRAYYNKKTSFNGTQFWTD